MPLEAVNAVLLYLVQHAEAKKEGDDPTRGLTDKGFREIALTALFAHDQGVAVNRIYHSGIKRAQQSAQILADQMHPKEGVSEADWLAPMDDPKIWEERLSNMHEDIMLVSHLPYLAKLASLLACGDGGKDIIDFKKAGIVCLKRFDDGHWAVEWMVTPEMAG
jgi:phosphohistidine phosphatase